MESQGLDKARHRNLVEYLHVDTENDYMVMEYLPGNSLKEVLLYRQTPFTWHAAQPWLRQIAEALWHSRCLGFICDPNAENIVFTPTRPFIPKIIDWHSWSSDDQYVSSLAVESMCYIASELFLGRELIDEELYAFEQGQLSPILKDHPAYPQFQEWLKEKDRVNLEKDVIPRMARAREPRRYETLYVTPPQQDTASSVRPNQ